LAAWAPPWTLLGELTALSRSPSWISGGRKGGKALGRERDKEGGKGDGEEKERGSGERKEGEETAVQ